MQTKVCFLDAAVVHVLSFGIDIGISGSVSSA
jgi:hypothetical protein